MSKHLYSLGQALNGKILQIQSIGVELERNFKCCRQKFPKLEFQLKLVRKEVDEKSFGEIANKNIRKNAPNRWDVVWSRKYSGRGLALNSSDAFWSLNWVSVEWLRQKLDFSIDGSLNLEILKRFKNNYECPNFQKKLQYFHLTTRPVAFAVKYKW